MVQEIQEPNIFGEVRPQKRSIDVDILGKALYEAVSGLSLEDLARTMINYPNALIAYAGLFYDQPGESKLISLLFNPHRLSTATSVGASIYQRFQDQRSLRGVARFSLYKRRHDNAPLGGYLCQALEVGVDSMSPVSDFPPLKARNIAKQYRLCATSRVLDPCGGWGGRMIGLSTVVNYYEAYEPATVTAQGLDKLCAFIRTVNPKFQAVIHCLPFEDSQVQKGSFDFAVTSPPYYDIEHYSDEPTNSCNRYGTFDDWVSGFFYPLIDKTMSALKSRKPFIINIGSRRYPLADLLVQYCQGKCQVRQVPLFDKVSRRRADGSDIGKGEIFFELVKVR